LLQLTPWVRRLVLVDRVHSTNDLARELGERGAPEGTVVIAEEQSGGRGRHGRIWHSPRGLGLYLSVLLRPAVPDVELTRWTLGAAVAACETCRKLVPSPVEIRWPNDLVCGGAKLAGVLAESRTGGSATHALVLGTGLNVAHEREDFPSELARSATSLRLLGADESLDRERVAASYLDALGGIVRELGAGRWDHVRSRWEALAPGAWGARVRVTTRDRSGDYDGHTAGLDELGALRVRRSDGGLASVRGIDSVRPAGVGEG
jgi:BirA family biotin operon repressor/biotin-[acetyl-CoA-carboxylase] ligase